MSRPTIPDTLDDLTPSWFSDAFEAEGKFVAGQVSSINVSELTETSGQNGFYALVDLKFAELSPGVPSRVFVKILRPLRRVGFQLEQQVREQFFYREFAPRTAARVPVFYYGDYSSDFRSGVLVTEALDGWEFGSLEQGIDIPRAHAVARALGLLNGSSLNDPRLELNSAVLRYDAGSQIVRNLQEGYSVSLKKHRSEFAVMLRPQLMSLVERVASSAEQILVDLKSGEVSANHGDCRVDNMAFRQTSNGWEVALFDFGVFSAGDGMPDFSQCLASAMPSVGQDEMRSIVDTYWHALCESGPYNASIEETWQRYRRSMVVALINRIFSLSQFDSVAQLEHGTPLERMRFNAWKNVMTHSENLRIWELA